MLLLDEMANPFPAGVQVFAYIANGPIGPATLVSSGWTRAGGTVPEITTLQAGTAYTLVFIGRQAPPFNYTFDYDGSGTVTVMQYASSSLSTSGYAALQAQRLWPKGVGWWGDAARQPGGVAWALAYGIGAALNYFDAAIQKQLESSRLQSCSGTEAASWATDFLGSLLPQYPSEPIDAYIGRVMQWLQNKSATSVGIATVVKMFLAALQYFPTQPIVGMDTQGSLDNYGSLDDPIVTSQASAVNAAIATDTRGALDTLGGFDVASTAFNPPNVIVFDWQDNPTLAAIMPLAQDQGEFCVYFQYPGHSDSGMTAMGNVPTILQTWVNAIKAAGTLAIFATNLPQT